MESAGDRSEKLAGGLAESSIGIPIKPDVALTKVKTRFPYATLKEIPRDISAIISRIRSIYGNEVARATTLFFRDIHTEISNLDIDVQLTDLNERLMCSLHIFINIYPTDPLPLSLREVKHPWDECLGDPCELLSTMLVAAVTSLQIPLDDQIEVVSRIAEIFPQEIATFEYQIKGPPDTTDDILETITLTREEIVYTVIRALRIKKEVYGTVVDESQDVTRYDQMRTEHKINYAHPYSTRPDLVIPAGEVAGALYIMNENYSPWIVLAVNEIASMRYITDYFAKDFYERIERFRTQNLDGTGLSGRELELFEAYTTARFTIFGYNFIFEAIPRANHLQHMMTGLALKICNFPVYQDAVAKEAGSLAYAAHIPPPFENEHMTNVMFQSMILSIMDGLCRFPIPGIVRVMGHDARLKGIWNTFLKMFAEKNRGEGYDPKPPFRIIDFQEVEQDVGGNDKLRAQAYEHFSHDTLAATIYVALEDGIRLVDLLPHIVPFLQTQFSLKVTRGQTLEQQEYLQTGRYDPYEYESLHFVAVVINPENQEVLGPEFELHFTLYEPTRRILRGLHQRYTETKLGLTDKTSPRSVIIKKIADVTELPPRDRMLLLEHSALTAAVHHGTSSSFIEISPQIREIEEDPLYGEEEGKKRLLLRGETVLDAIIKALDNPEATNQNVRYFQLQQVIVALTRSAIYTKVGTHITLPESLAQHLADFVGVSREPESAYAAAVDSAHTVDIVAISDLTSFKDEATRVKLEVAARFDPKAEEAVRLAEAVGFVALQQGLSTSFDDMGQFVNNTIAVLTPKLEEQINIVETLIENDLVRYFLENDIPLPENLNKLQAIQDQLPTDIDLVAYYTAKLEGQHEETTTLANRLKNMLNEKVIDKKFRRIILQFSRARTVYYTPLRQHELQLMIQIASRAGDVLEETIKRYLTYQLDSGHIQKETLKVAIQSLKEPQEAYYYSPRDWTRDFLEEFDLFQQILSEE